MHINDAYVKCRASVLRSSRGSFISSMKMPVTYYRGSNEKLILAEAWDCLEVSDAAKRDLL